jgi:phosphatidylglycerophosphatase C
VGTSARDLVHTPLHQDRLGMQLAVFDLDGTITRHDTTLPYLLGYVKTCPWRVFGLVLALPTAVLHLIGLTDRGTLKASIVRGVLGGCTREQIDRWTERWVEVLLERGVFRDALSRIAEHRAAGDVLVLMSASLDIYVPAIGRRLGFDEVTCTGVRWHGARLHGALMTPNCRGEDKVRRIEGLRAQHPGARLVAYGNAASDLPHLRLADRGVLVNGNRRARRKAERVNVVCESWS